jgi:hypothetical protein
LLFIGIFCFKELGNWKCYSWISTPSFSYRKLEVFTKNKKKKGWKRRTRFSFLNLFLLTSIKVRDTDIILLFYEKEKEKKKKERVANKCHVSLHVYLTWFNFLSVYDCLATCLWGSYLFMFDLVF